MAALMVALCGCLAVSPSFGAHYKWDQNHDPFGTQTSPPPDGNQPGCNLPASPFEVATGNYFYRYEDFSAKVIGPELRFVRTYNSRDLRSGSLGVGWTHTYDIRLLDLTDGVTVTALCRKGTGKRFRFQREPDGSYEPPSAFYSELVALPGGGFSLKQVDGTKMVFGADGLLTAVEDREGNQLTLTYDTTGFLTTVTGATGAQITLTKGADGKIASATDPRGQVFEYGYDTEGRLTSVTNPLDEVTTFVYGTDGKLEEIRDSLTRTVQDLSHDGEERLAGYVEDGVTWTVDYSPGESKATKTDPLGEQWVVHYNENGSVVQQVDPLGGELDIGYDANWRPTTITDQRDGQWTFLYDQFGNVARIIDPLTNTTDFLYDASGELLELVTFPSGSVMDPSYDPAGRLSGISDAEGSWFTVVEYNGDGTIARLADANAQVWTGRYDGQSHLREIESPMGSITRFEVDVAGDPQAFVDADGHRFELPTDDLGRLEKIIDPDLKETIFEYAPSCPTCYEDWLLSLVRDASGREFRWHYDLFGRLTRTVRGGTETTDLGYDGRGLLDSITDPRGIETTLTYDERGLLETVSQPDAGVTTYGFDPAKNLVQVDDAEGATTARILDAVGRTESVTSPATGLTEFTHTPEGRRQTRTDARSVTAIYGYDGRARLLGLSFADPSDNISFAWDESASENGGGRLTSMTDGSGSTRYHYDLDGRLKRVDTDIEGVANSTSYGYTAGDRLESLTYPSGIRVDYFYDSRGLVESVRLVDGGQTDPVVSSALYDDAGRLESWVHGNGLTETWVYDTKGRVQSITAGSAHQVSYGRGPAGRVTSMTDHLDPSLNRTYGYDGAGRLTNATGPWGAVTYGYDLVGNRTSRAEGACATTYQYADSRLSTLSGCESASYQYDPAGNTSSDGTLEYEYNQLGRLDRVLDGGVEVASYTYNAANQRVKKETASGTIYYHYDSVGNLLEEVDEQGNVLASYIYLPDNRPLAQVVNGELFHYHLDQLATPRRLTDALGAIAWSAELWPFGAVWQEDGAVDQRLRFPGQHYDEESGLHYNWHRFYDPSLGRYLRADPVGPQGDWLVAGQQRLGDSYSELFFLATRPSLQPFGYAGGPGTLYGYVLGDPVNLIDPEGRFFNVVAGAVGGVVGGLVNGVYAYTKGQSFWKGAAVGAAAGLISGLTLNPFLAGALIGAATTAGNIYSGIDCSNGNIGAAIATGAGFGLIGGGIGGYIGHAGGYIANASALPAAQSIGQAVGTAAGSILMSGAGPGYVSAYKSWKSSF